MIDVQTVIDYIKANTTFDVQLAQDIQPNLQETFALPQVFVGYSTIKSKFPNQIRELDVLNSNGEDLVQAFEIQIVCEQSNFRAIWITLFKLLITWNPIPTEIMHTGFTYQLGGKMGSNVRFWWTDVYVIGFPTGLSLQ